MRNVIPSEGIEGFDWSAYSDGWNGSSLKKNSKVKTLKKKDVVYSHDDYAKRVYSEQFNKVRVNGTKEVKKDTLVTITDMQPMDNGMVLATINNGASNVIIDLDKENRYMAQLRDENGESITKETFLKYIQNEKVKSSLIGKGILAKVGTDTEKVSIWDAFVVDLKQKMIASIKKHNNAFVGKVISTNNGSFTVLLGDCVKCFMPGSLAAKNRVTDYKSLVGKTMEVMVESYDEKNGFVVSRKSFVNKMTPVKMAEFKAMLEENKDVVLKGTVTGSKPYGVYIELDEFLTGMLHKSLVSDSLREAMRNGSVADGSTIDVYVDSIDGDRIILSDVAPSERDAVKARRAAEDEAEKAVAANA